MTTLMKCRTVLKTVVSLQTRTIFELASTQHQSQQTRDYIALTPNQVAALLRMDETTLDGRIRGKFPVRGFDSNQLAANSPIEDRRTVARILSNNASMFGIFDGHAGPACAQAVSERLFDYIAVSLLSEKELEQFNHDLREGKPNPLMQLYNFKDHYYSDELVPTYKNSLQKFVVETLSTSGVDDVEATVSQKNQTCDSTIG